MIEISTADHAYGGSDIITTGNATDYVLGGDDGDTITTNGGHDIVLGSPEYLFGGGQAIIKMTEGYCAGSDHRKEGLALGY